MIKLNTNLFSTLSKKMDMFYEIIGVIAGLSTAIPSIPQIFRTLKTKNVKGLST